MKAIKGCVNNKCAAWKKKAYKEEDSYCSICGHSLQYVCKNCYTQLPNGKERYCLRCKAERADKANHRKVALGGIVPGALAVGAIAVKYGEKAFEFVRDIIDN